MRYASPYLQERSGQVARTREYPTYTVGVCATGEAPGLEPLLRSLLARPAPGFGLRRVVVVASECPPSVISSIEGLRSLDPRVDLVEQERRTGKADAINAIIREREGEFLVFVNADALPSPESVSRLLERIEEEDDVGVVSGQPVFEVSGGPVSSLLEVMWTAHNLASSVLNERGLSNHGTDELMVVRSALIEELPRGIVNDGAYISGKMRARGYKIAYLPDATVKIDVPNRITDLIMQRRRILFGHIQIGRLVGKVPRTVETLMISSPLDAFVILTRTLASHPRLILALPLAAVGELVALTGALWDTVTSSQGHVVWRRYTD